MADVFNLVLPKVLLDHIHRFPMRRQWVPGDIWVGVFKTQNSASHKVLNLSLQLEAIFYVMARSARMIDTVQVRLIPPLRVGRYSRRISGSNQLPLY